MREGEYKIRVEAKRNPKVRSLSKQEFEAESEESRDYGAGYYPGVAEVAQAAVVMLAPGAQMDGLDFKLEKESLRRLKGQLVGWEGESANFGLAFPIDFGGRRMTSAGKLEKAEFFEIENLPEGPLHLMVFNEEGSKRGNVPVDLHGKEEKVMVLAEAGVDLAMETVPALQGVKIYWYATDRFGMPKEVDSVETDEKGTAVFPGRFREDPARISFRDLPEGLTLRKAIYGETVDLRRFVLDPNQGERKLVLQFGKLENGIAGRVKRGNEAEAGAWIFAVREPLRNYEFPLQVREAMAKGDGSYSLKALEPGTWRVLAGAAADHETYGRLERGEGTRVEVKEDGLVTLDFNVD